MTFLLLCLLAAAVSASDKEFLIPDTPSLYATNSLAFSPDGNRLASTGGGKIRIWNIESGEEEIEPLNLTGGRHMTFSRDGKFLINSGRIGNDFGGDSRADFLRSGRSIIINLEEETYSANREFLLISLSSDGETIAIGNDVIVYLVDPETFDTKLEISRDQFGPYFSFLAFHPGGNMLATGTTDDIIYIWNTETGEKIVTLLGSDHWDVTNLEFSPDGRLLASISNNNRLKVWDTNTWGISSYFNKPVGEMSFSPDSNLLAVSLAESWAIEILSTVTWEPTATLEHHEGREGYLFNELTALAMSSRYLASAGTDSLIKLWEYDTPDIPTSIEQTNLGSNSRLS